MVKLPVETSAHKSRQICKEITDRVFKWMDDPYEMEAEYLEEIEAMPISFRVYIHNELDRAKKVRDEQIASYGKEFMDTNKGD